MQQLELFTVASILWGGILVFLLYIFIRMVRLEATMKRITRSMNQEQEVPSTQDGDQTTEW